MRKKQRKIVKVEETGNRKGEWVEVLITLACGHKQKREYLEHRLGEIEGQESCNCRECQET